MRTLIEHPDELTGWKAIAAYLGKSVRAAQRWEKHYGLPVRRICAGSGAFMVYAHIADIELWKATLDPRTQGALDSEPDHDDANRLHAGADVPRPVRSADAAHAIHRPRILQGFAAAAHALSSALLAAFSPFATGLRANRRPHGAHHRVPHA